MATLPWGSAGGFERGPKKRKRVNPETILTGQIRELMKLMRIPHEKHWGGPMSPKGIPDLISTLPGPSESKRADGHIIKHPGGRAFWCELKTPGKKPTDEQFDFLEKMKTAGALSFWCDNPNDFIAQLAAAKFEPAMRIKMQFRGQMPTPKPGGGSGRFKPAMSRVDPPNPEAGPGDQP